VLGVALAGAGGALALAFTLKASLRQRALVVPDVAFLEKKLRAGSDEDARAAILVAFADAAPAMLDAMTTRDALSVNAGAVALDERLGELDRRLSEHRGVPGASVRIALSSAALGAIVELVQDLRGLTSALSAAVVGLAAAAACFELGRTAAARATALRADWDRIALAAANRLGAGVAPRQGATVPSAVHGDETGQNSGSGRGNQRRRRRRGS